MPATPSRLQIGERTVGDVTILLLSGEITLDDGDLAYGREINQLVEQQRTKILVDLSDVTRIDSSGLGMMAAKVKDVRREPDQETTAQTAAPTTAPRIESSR